MEVYKILESVRGKKGVLVLEVPLLFESRMDKMVDFRIVVTSGRAAMLARAARKGVPRTLAEKILASQWPLSRKAKLADYVISNDGTPIQLRAAVKKVHREITKA